MAEYVTTSDALVALNGTIPFSVVSIPCNKGNVLPLAIGVLNLKGNTPNRFARYRVTLQGNIAIPTGGTVGEISLALALNGEPIQSSRARVTPAAVENYFNVTSTAIITVPRGCCPSIAVENTSGQDIEVQNANLTVSRIA